MRKSNTCLRRRRSNVPSSFDDPEGMLTCMEVSSGRPVGAGERSCRGIGVGYDGRAGLCRPLWAVVAAPTERSPISHRAPVNLWRSCSR